MPNSKFEIRSFEKLLENVYDKKLSCVVKLSPTSDEQILAFKSKLRKKLRKAEKKGFNIRLGGVELFDDFYDLYSKKVRSFRAPGFSITESNKWIFEILHELGITIDSSVFAAKRGHGGLSKYSTSKPSIQSYSGAELKEFPINTHSVLRLQLIFSGGGYFRLFSYPFTKHFSKKSDYTMTYFHPSGFDYEQPIILELSSLRKFISYVGFRKCKSKLEQWIHDFESIDLDTAIKQTDWNQAQFLELAEVQQKDTSI